MTVIINDGHGHETKVRTFGHYRARIELEPGNYRIWAVPNVPPGWQRALVRSAEVTRITVGCPGIV
jgi:hypothetical protein